MSSLLGYILSPVRLHIIPTRLQYIVSPGSLHIIPTTLQRQNAENLKQIIPEKEYRGLSPNFNIHVSVSELYIPTIGLPVLRKYVD
jgi:hypothetical protein